MIELIMKQGIVGIVFLTEGVVTGGFWETLPFAQCLLTQLMVCLSVQESDWTPAN